MSKSHPNNDITGLPLTGKKILVTRPGEQGITFATKLENVGAQAIILPTIEIVEPSSALPLDVALEKIESYQWIFFASSNAVLAFIKRLSNKYQLNWQKLNKKEERLAADIIAKLPKIAAIGEMTAAAATDFGLEIDYCPSNYLAEDFIAQFPGYPSDLSGTKILWPRNNRGRDFIIDKLQAAGVCLDVIPAYQSIFPRNAEELSDKVHHLIKNKGLDAITLASKQTAINLAKIICMKATPIDIRPNLLSSSSSREGALPDLKHLLTDILIVTIGPEASEGALNYLGKVNLEARPHTTQGMIAALVEYYSLSGCSSKKLLTNPE